MNKTIKLSNELRCAIREEVTAAVREAMQQSPTLAAADRAMRLKEVMQTCALSRSSIYSKIDKGEFPAGFLIGPNARAWLHSDITNWLNARIAAANEA